MNMYIRRTKKMSKIIAEASGQWLEPYYTNEWGWNVNMSCILTKLIQYAGRYVDNYASDLFIIWKYNVENREKLRNKDWNETIFIGFRQYGVDNSSEPWGVGNKVCEQYKNNMYYYRRIVKLVIGPHEYGKGWIDMKLKVVA